MYERSDVLSSASKIDESIIAARLLTIVKASAIAQIPAINPARLIKFRVVEMPSTSRA